MAQAVVTAVTREGGAPINMTWTPVHYHLELRVHFDDGSTADTSCTVRAAIRGTELSIAEGDIVPVRYDPADRTKVDLDEAAMRAFETGRTDAFKAAAVARSELQISTATAAKASSSSPPTDAEMQAAYDAWDVAMAQASAGMEAYERAKASGNGNEAARVLREGAVHNAEQEVLGAEFKRLRGLRPDWKRSTPTP